MSREINVKIMVFVLILFMAGPSIAQSSAPPTKRIVVSGFEMRLAKSQPAPDTMKVEFEGEAYYLQKQSIVHAYDVKSVRLGRNPESGTWAILIKLRQAGGQKMRVATSKHLRETLCVTVVDQIVQCGAIRGVFGALFQLTFDSAQQARRNYRLITGHADSTATHSVHN
ncbi:MAG: SecDF P1 head subdomain-containing protein [Terriglobia bacterium]